MNKVSYQNYYVKSIKFNLIGVKIYGIEETGLKSSIPAIVYLK